GIGRRRWKEKQGGGTAILWRIERRRNRRSIESFGRYRSAGLEAGKGLAPARVEWGELWSLNSGVEWKTCITVPWSWTRADVQDFSNSPVRTTKYFVAK